MQRMQVSVAGIPSAKSGPGSQKKPPDQGGIPLLAPSTRRGSPTCTRARNEVAPIDTCSPNEKKEIDDTHLPAHYLAGGSFPLPSHGMSPATASLQSLFPPPIRNTHQAPPPLHPSLSELCCSRGTNTHPSISSAPAPSANFFHSKPKRFRPLSGGNNDLSGGGSGSAGAGSGCRPRVGRRWAT
ncbi:hypothetical protein K438DRAFT_773598 [Mycena galopus ATCC 62051]|nr:hypothetical protein K438DRAFT_773598 [Mycena galopus ATCC 62051]